MGALDDLAARNTRRLEVTAALSSTDTSTYTAVAASDSFNGAVDVILADDVASPEYDADSGLGVELPTTVSVRKGDVVLVTGYGGNVIENPVVTGNVGGGDRMQEEIDDAVELASSVEGLAQQAVEIANATGQYFWSDTDGAHVTQVPKEDWQTSQTGPNSIWNSLGMLIRDGLTNLLAILTDGLAIYDGNGNDASNIVAAFSSGGAQVGYTDRAHVSITDSSLTFSDENGNVAGVMDSSGGTVTEFITKVVTLNPPGHDATIGFVGVPDLTAGNITISLTFSTGVTLSYPLLQYGQSYMYGEGGTYRGSYSAEETADGWELALDDSSQAKVTSVRGSWYTTRNEPIFDWHGHVEQSIKTGTVNLSNIGSGTKALNLWREGHVVHASMIATATAGTANSAITCGTIPEGFRPIANEFQSGACVSNNTLNGYFRWRVATTGVVTYWCSVTAIRESPLCMTWLTDDAW